MSIETKKKLAKIIRYFSLLILLIPVVFLLGVVGWVFVAFVADKFFWNWYWLFFIIPAILAAANWWAEDYNKL